MKKARKECINCFGEESVSSVQFDELVKEYMVIREKDGIALAVGNELKGYLGDIIRTMYTGKEYGTGDFILVSDRHGMICKFK